MQQAAVFSSDEPTVHDQHQIDPTDKHTNQLFPKEHSATKTKKAGGDQKQSEKQYWIYFHQMTVNMKPYVE